MTGDIDAVERQASASAAAPTGPRAGGREWIGLAMLALPALLVSMDMTVLHLAVPQLSADLRPSGSQLLWIVDIYGFTIAGFLITMGTLGDRIGRRRLLLIGAAAFGAASVLAAFSTGAEMLIAARALLGVAGATLAPSTLALIRNMFHDRQQRTTAISVWLMSFLSGAAVGPLIGGVLLEFFWWGSVFLISVPVMALLLAVGPRLLPEYRDCNARPLDLPSAAMSLAAVLALVYALKQIAEHGPEPAGIAIAIAGLGLGIAFVRRQRTLIHPLVDLHLFADRTFSVALGALTTVTLVLGGSGYLLAQYLQLVLGLSPLAAGLWTLPPLVAGIAATMLAPVAMRRIGPGYVISAGLALAAAGFLVLAQVSGDSQLTVVVAGLTVAFIGIFPVATLGVDMIVGVAPPERAGSASAISETVQELGIAVGIAVLGTIASGVYRRQVTEAIPEGTPARTAEATRDTLGGAAAAAGELPPAVLDTATTAFTSGLQLAAILCALALTAAAVAAAVVLRSVPANALTDSVERLS